MWQESLALQSLSAFFITISVIVVGTPIARHFRLSDKPTDRKHHEGDIPLIGGIAIFVALFATSYFWGEANETLITVNGVEALGIFMSCGAFLVLTGVVDDRFRLGVFIRILSEALVAIAVIELLDLRAAYLGDLLGTGTLRLDPELAYAFTVFAIVGIINAFNMVDGMDGLLGSLVIVSLVLFHLFTSIQPGFVSLSICSSLCAFLVSNLGLSPLVPKTFLGDAGSKLLGFIVVCLLLAAASAQVGAAKLIQPATALFVVAVPLFDMVFTSLRRMIRKGSPFAADRSHIHHLLQDLGFSDRRSVVMITCIHGVIVLVGLLLHRAKTPEYFQFSIFLALFALYSLLCSQFWLAAERFRTTKATLQQHLQLAHSQATGEVITIKDGKTVQH